MKDFTRLPDGRAICKRDVGSVVLDDREAEQICERLKKDLDRQFIQSLTVPEKNGTGQLMDRVKLLELYRIIGNDHACPNTLGRTETKFRGGKRSFKISLLSGRSRENLMTTCVHEYAHTWISENVLPHPPAEDRASVQDTDRSPPDTQIAASSNLRPALPERLNLQGIVWSKTQPMATINGRNFDLNQGIASPLRSGIVTGRCLELRPAAVVLKTNSSTDPLVLELK